MLISRGGNFLMCLVSLKILFRRSDTILQRFVESAVIGVGSVGRTVSVLSAGYFIPVIFAFSMDRNFTQWTTVPCPCTRQSFRYIHKRHKNEVVKPNPMIIIAAFFLAEYSVVRVFCSTVRQTLAIQIL